MAEWTAWQACDFLIPSFTSDTWWLDLSNASFDNANFAYAPAVGGKWAGSGLYRQTDTIQVGTSNLEPLIPSNATVSKIQTRFRGSLPITVPVVPDILFFKTDQPGLVLQLFATIPKTAGDFTTSYLQDYTPDAPSQAEAWDVINGVTESLFMKCGHQDTSSVDWQLNLRYVDIRVEFTRVPNVPRTAFLGTF